MDFISLKVIFKLGACFYFIFVLSFILILIKYFIIVDAIQKHENAYEQADQKADNTILRCMH